MDKKILIIFMIILIYGCSVKESFVDIPFYKQTDSGNCLQANLKMALKHYYPEKDYSFELLDNLTGRTSGKWTWTSQAMPVLVDERLDVCYYSTTPYEDILKGGEEFILDYYGLEDGNVMISHTNFDSLYKSIELLENLDCYENRKLSFDEVEDYFNKGNIVILILDKSTLYDTNSGYTGHFVTLTGINKTHVRFHDSGAVQNKAENKQKFIDSWNAKGTDNDVIVIKGKFLN